MGLELPVSVADLYPVGVRHYVIHIEFRYEYPSRTIRVVDTVRLSSIVAVGVRLPGRGGVVGLPRVHTEYVVIVPASRVKHIVASCCHPLADECAPQEAIEELLSIVNVVDWKDLGVVVEERRCDTSGFCSRKAVYEYRPTSDLLVLIYGWSSAWSGYGTNFDVVSPSNAEKVVELSD